MYPYSWGALPNSWNMGLEGESKTGKTILESKEEFIYQSEEDKKGELRVKRKIQERGLTRSKEGETRKLRFGK